MVGLPINLPVVGNLNPFDNREPTINPKLPETLASLERKWAQFQPYLGEVREDAVNAVFDMDRQRVLRGQRPLGTKDTARALFSANRGDTITPQPKRNPFNVIGNAVDDVGTIATGVFKLPFALAHEVTELPHVAQRISEGEGNAIQRVLRAPGIRLLPGAYTAANVAGGDVNEITTHPVMTALDLLPFASKFAKGTALNEAVVARDVKAGVRPTAPVAALVTNRLDEAGQLQRTRIGQMLDLAAATKPGTYAKSAFGKLPKAVMREQVYTAEALKEALIPGAPIDKRLAGMEPVIQHVRRATEELNTMPGMSDPAFREQVMRMAELDDVAGATPDQLAVVAKARELAVEREAIVLSHNIAMRGPSLKGQAGEIYSRDVAESLWKRQVDLERRTQMTALAQHIANGTGDLDALSQRASDVLNAPLVDRYFGGTVGATKRSVLQQKVSGAITKKAKVEELRGISYAMDSAGFDGHSLRTVLRRWQVGKSTDAELAAAIDHLRTNRPPRDLTAPETHWETKGKAKIANEYTPKALAKAERGMERAGQEALPSRFEPLVREGVRQKAREQWVAVEADPTKAARLSELIAANRFSELPGFDQKWLNDTVDGVAKSWQDLRDAGADPMFMHHASESQVAQMTHPYISETPIETKQARTRVLDFTPYTNDLVASFNHGGFEILKRHVQEGFLETIRDRGILKTRAEVEAMFRNRAERAAGAADPRLASYQTRLEKLIGTEWKPFDPEAYGYNWSSKRLTQIKEDGLMIPKYMADNFERAYSPKNLTLTAAFDPVMKVFRTSVLALSPRWHVGNIVSGAILSTAEAGPLQWKHASNAWQMARDATNMTPEGAFAVDAASLYRNAPDDLRHSFAAHKSVFDDLDIAKARKLGTTFLEAMDDRWSKGAVSALESNAVQRSKGFVSRVAEMSYAFNQKVDMFYRSMAYLRGEEKALRRGMTREAAEAAGLEMSRNVLQDWAAMTPIERSIFRSVFPFYSYISFIMRYALRYPIDHPVRASIMNSIANAELDDMQAGLPPRFLGTIFFGGADSRGRTNAFEPGGLNPFKDVGSYLTVAGFLSAMNPAFDTILQQAGVKMGKADPFPELRYNAQTGQLEAVKPNIVSSFIKNTIPQAELVTYFMGKNAELTDQFRRDPEGARRRLLQSVGIPQPFRKYSIPGEIARNELNLAESATTAQSRAFQTGNDNLARNYPTVAALLDKVRGLPASTLQQYQPTREIVDQFKPNTSPASSYDAS